MCPHATHVSNTLAYGGSPIHSVKDIDGSCLGYAGKVNEVTFGGDKHTFVEDCKHAKSCTSLLQGPNAHAIAKMKDVVFDGLRGGSSIHSVEDM